MDHSMNMAAAEPFAFTRPAIMHLIGLYEQYSELYNSSMPKYKNKHIRQDRFRKITAEFNVLYPGVTVSEVKKNEILRTQFFNEFNKVKKSMLSGSGKDDIYKPTWWCFEALSFLNVNQPINQGDSNLQVPQPETEETEHEIVYEGTVDHLNKNVVMMDSSLLSPAGSSQDFRSSVTPSVSIGQGGRKKSAKRKAESQSSDADDLLRDATDALRATSSEAPPDHLEAFALYVFINLAAEMRRIRDPKIVNRFKRKCLNDVYDILDEQDM